MSRFPFYKQLDQMDCGPTCVQMIAKHYGKYLSIVGLRKKSNVGRNGASLLSLSDCVDSVGFRSIAVRIPFEKLKADAPLPCIVYWNQSHFVIVYKISRGKVFVADPAKGLITYTQKEFCKVWLSNSGNYVSKTNRDNPIKDVLQDDSKLDWQNIAETEMVSESDFGIALLLEPTPSFYIKEQESETDTRQSLTYLLGYLKKHKSLLLNLTLGLLTGSLIQLFLPFLTQGIVDVGINTQNINFIYVVLAGQIMLLVSRMTVDFVRRWIMLHLSTRISVAMISDFLVKLFQLPMTFFESKTIGDILRRIEDHSRVERFLSTSSLSIVFSFFNVIVFGIVLAIYNISIFLVFFGLSALYVVYILLFMKRREVIDYKRFQQMADNQSNLIQVVQGMSEIKMNNCEKQKRWDWERIQAKLFNVTEESIRLQQWQDAGSVLLNESKNMLITVMAALSVINGEITLGMMMAIQYIIGQLNSPVNDFIAFSREYQDAKISLKRIGEVHGAESEEVQSGYGENSVKIGLAKCTGDVRIENISFQYGGYGSPKVLDGIDLVIPEGKVTAIVGSSGSGKTTLLKLLAKLYRPSSGKIVIGDEHLERIKTNEWRSQCSIVMQDGFIFSDTIARNIAMADDEIDFTKVIQAARIANISEFIDGLPLGYNSKVGVNGLGLSAGQKQRLLIARAVYKDPLFLFFDEATSALDANNEKAIMRNLVEVYKGRTVVVIAHRLSTVKNADQIVLLENGRITESGSHDQLTLLNGRYFELVSNQLR